MSYDGGYCFLKSGIVNKSMSIGTNNNNIICGLQSSITTTTSTITTTILPFYGVQNNVARSQLNEYTIVYDVSYSSVTTDLIINNIKITCTSSTSLCFGCYNSNNPNNILTVACGRCLDVLTYTIKNSPYYSNGVYWYFTSSNSIGYSSLNDINQNSCDTTDGISPNKKVCWHLGGSDGWRCGSNKDDNSFNKIIFKK